jgi:hypothetical protein
MAGHVHPERGATLATPSHPEPPCTHELPESSSC